VHAIQGAQQGRFAGSPKARSAQSPFIGNPHVDVEQYLLWAVEKIPFEMVIRIGNGAAVSRPGCGQIGDDIHGDSGFADACI